MICGEKIMKFLENRIAKSLNHHEKKSQV
jgi:hypothetical protein